MFEGVVQLLTPGGDFQNDEFDSVRIDRSYLLGDTFTDKISTCFLDLKTTVILQETLRKASWSWRLLVYFDNGGLED